MPKSGEMPAGSTGRVARDIAGESVSTRFIHAVEDLDLSGPYSAFESFLVDLSSALTAVQPDELETEILRWLKRLAEQLGAELCTIGEYRESDGNPESLLQWTVGNQPLPLFTDPDSWAQARLAAGELVTLSSLDDLPEEAAASRRVLEAMRIRSGLWVPMVIEELVVGAIGLGTLSEERTWPPAIVNRCRLVAQVLGNALLRRRRALEISKRKEFEALVAGILARFANTGDHMNDQITTSLQQLGEILEVDRVSYLHINPESSSLIPTHQWRAEGIAEDAVPLDENVAPSMPWLAGEMLTNRATIVNYLDDIPEEAKVERQYCREVGIQSFVMVPGRVDGELYAALALDTIREARRWDARTIKRLSVVTQVIADAQVRECANSEIERVQLFERAISTVAAGLVNLPPELVASEIEKGLKIVGEALGADTITLALPQADGDLRVVYEWTSERLPGHVYKGEQFQDFSWLADQIRNNELVTISKLSEWPPEATAEIASCRKHGLEATNLVPFQLRNDQIGYVIISWAGPQVALSHLVVQQQLVGKILGEALSRREAELALRDSLTEIEALKDSLRKENVYLRQEAKVKFRTTDIVGDSAALQETLVKVQQVAPTDSTVLILGETGTGKELIARAIHENSSRRDNLMVQVNCASLPSTLIEAELFGREKGAYTGALTRELGRFEIADGSTIMLDEIGEMSLDLQAKLLRVLQDGEFERLGSTKTRKVDVRVIAATNRDLAEAMEKKEFREDLYYRLNVFPIAVPPLRERVEDMSQLVWAFVQEFSQTMGKTIEAIPANSMDALKSYSWPGNVREVRNVIERAMIVSPGPTLQIELPVGRLSPGVDSRRLADVEYEHIRSVVESTNWRVRGPGGAADILGLKPTTLEARMKKLGLKRA